MEGNNISCSQLETRAESTLRKLWGDEYFTDVTLVTEDNRHIKAHKVILSSFSEFFREVFLNNSALNIVIFLKGVSFQNLEYVLEFIYLGHSAVAQQDLPGFLVTGQELRISGVSEFVEACQVNINPTENGDTLEILTSENKQTVLEQYDREEIQPNIFDTQFKIDLINNENSWKVWEKLDKIPAIQQHQQIKNVKYSCDQCDGKFSERAGLRRHNMSKHLGVKFKCDECEFKSARQSSIKMHKLSKHSTERYKCDNCEYQFYLETDLIKHNLLRHEVNNF